MQSGSQLSPEVYNKYYNMYNNQKQCSLQNKLSIQDFWELRLHESKDVHKCEELW